MWKGIRRKPQGVYDLNQLIDHRRRASVDDTTKHIICDIDKTYLETQFSNIFQIAKIAFEAASDKRTVHGASEVLLAARWGAPNLSHQSPESTPRPYGLHFVSSSPPQLRSVLEDKLCLDGLDWSTDTFKNQAYNLKQRRVDLLRQHVAYKSAAILRLAATLPSPSDIYMFGDSAESDGFIYLGCKLFLEHRLKPSEYRRYLEIMGVETAIVSQLIPEGLQPPPKHHVKAILIRRLPDKNQQLYPPLTQPIEVFDSFFDAALTLMRLGVIEPENLRTLTRRFHNRYGLSLSQASHSLSSLLLALQAHGDVSHSALRKELQTVLSELETMKKASPWKRITRHTPSSPLPIMDRFQAMGPEEILSAARTWAGLAAHH